jgi:four helix bundle protein
MSNSDNKEIKGTKYDIHERIYQYILQVIYVTNKLSRTDANKVIVNQILRSVTSIGANDQEADGTLTKKDFIHCYTIIRKEAKETHFWLRLISDTNSELKSNTHELLQESSELIAVISSIINNTRKS